MSLNNKVVLITGGAEGIGFEIAKNVLDKEAKTVILVDINDQKGQAAAELLIAKYGDGRAHFIQGDVTKDLDDIFIKTTSAFAAIDVLVNNAGTINDKLVKKTIDVNVTALIEWSIKFWEYMRKDKCGNGGTIINIASVYGCRSDQFAPVYQASKFAVRAFTKSLGHTYNFNRTGVKVLALCPGFTRTRLTEVMILWDSDVAMDFQKFTETQLWQDVDVVGKAAVEILDKPSGSAWIIEGGLPVEEVV